MHKDASVITLNFKAFWLVICEELIHAHNQNCQDIKKITLEDKSFNMQ